MGRLDRALGFNRSLGSNRSLGFNRALWSVVGLLLVAVGGYGLAMHLGVLDGRLGELRRGSVLLSAPLVAQWQAWGRWGWVVVAAVGLLLGVVGFGVLAGQLRRRTPAAAPEITYRPAHAAPDAGGEAPVGVPAAADAEAEAALPPGDQGAPDGGAVFATSSVAVADATGVASEAAAPAYRPSERWSRLDEAMPGRHRALPMPGAERLPQADAGPVRGTALAHGVERDLTLHPDVRRASVRLLGSAARPALQVALDINGGAELDQVAAHVTESVQRMARTSGRQVAGVEVVVRLSHSDPSRVD